MAWKSVTRHGYSTGRAPFLGRIVIFAKYWVYQGMGQMQYYSSTRRKRGARARLARARPSDGSHSDGLFGRRSSRRHSMVTDTTCSLCLRDQNHVTIASEISFRIPSNIYLVNNRPSAWCALPLIDFTKSQRIPAALSPSYPPGSASKYPLKFDLEVIGNAPPTADQIRMILD